MDPSYSSINENSNKKAKTASYILGLALAGAIAAVIVLAVKLSQQSSSSSSSGGQSPAQLLQSNLTAQMKTWMDHTADPCTDFYQYACGGWIKNTPIPGDRSTIYLVIDEIENSNMAALRMILESDMDWPLIAPFYRECMNTSAIDSDGINAIKPLLSVISQLGDIHTPQAIMSAIGQLHAAGVPVFFSFSNGADLLDPTTSIGQLYQGGIALPDQSLYNVSEGLKDPYIKHITNMLQFTGEAADMAATHANAIWDLEVAMAQASLTSTEQRDINGTYHRLDLDGLMKLQPQLPWDAYFTALGNLGTVTPTSSIPINVQTVRFVQAVATLLTTTEVGKLQSYMRFWLIHTFADYLSTPIRNENFDFFMKTLNGVTVQKPRWKTCVSTVDNLLGHILGRYYTDMKFTKSAKQLAETMMKYVLSSMKDKLTTVDWMDEKTRVAAQTKLSQFSYQMGYPDHWKQYKGLTLKQESFSSDAMSIVSFLYGEQITGINKPVDKEAWGMTVPTVNAYYEPSMNHIVMPAGILQGFYFNELFHPAINFGGTGGTDGHEMTHGFDDQGSQYDGKGRFVNWWSPSVLANWHERSTCVADFYSKYEVLPGRYLNGWLTLGENIADCGGIKQAYTAYKNYMKDNPQPVPGLDVTQQYFTGTSVNNDQLFFLSYAMGWCFQATPQAARNRLATDPHSPGKFRVNGPFSNFDTFGEVFKCPVGSPMRPKDMCNVW